MAKINRSKTVVLSWEIAKSVTQLPFGTNVANIPIQRKQTVQISDFDILTLH
jgi:hypothetical protein